MTREADINAALDEAEASRFTGSVRYGTAPVPAEPPKQRVRPAVDPNDNEYWIYAALWRPLSARTLAVLTSIPRDQVIAHLEQLERDGKVRRSGELWERKR